MPCYNPLTGWYSRFKNDSGKRSLTFKSREGFSDLQVKVPCGQCIGCRLERSRQWAIRCVHEASLYENNCFITLTFDDKHLEPSGSLVKADFQKFMKRLRKMFGSGVRYYHCGEYGEKLKRPHHHACLFNFDFPDKELWDVRDGVRLYRSGLLEKLWPFGFSTVGEVTFESAAYVARYVTKKITGEKAASYYGSLEPEYTTMSRRPGIASRWINQFKRDVYPHDFVVIRDGRKCRPPKYYDRSYELTDPDQFGLIKRKRVERAMASKDNSPDRLAARHKLQVLRARKLKRGYEGDSALPIFKKVKSPVVRKADRIYKLRRKHEG